MTPPPEPLDVEGLRRIAEALRAPSLEQDSQWHTEKAVYATKPRALLTEAASALFCAEARATKAESDLIEARKLVTRYAREAGEAKGRLEMSEAAGVVEGWRERAEAAESRLGRRPDPTDLFEALEEGLCEGSPTISLTAGHIWIDGETSFDARTVIAALFSPPKDSSQ